MFKPRHVFRTARLASLVAFSVLSACGGSDGVPTPLPTPTVAVSAAAAVLAATPASPGVVAVSIVRGGGFAGNVTLTAENLPAGVTATFGAPTLASPATSTSLTLSVGATAVSGVSPVTIRASGNGVTSSTFIVQLTVSVPSFNLTAPTATIAALQGGTATLGLTLERLGGFTGVVNVALEGLPANVTGSFTPPSFAAGSTAATMTLVVGANASVGTTPITIRATGTGAVDRTVVLQLTVQTVPLVQIQWNVCDATRVPVYFAVRDGLAGAWRRITPTGNTYSFTLAGNIGTVAVVQLNALNRLFIVYETYMTVISGTSAELAEIQGAECALQPARGKSLSGSISPAVSASEIAYVSAGWGSAVLGPGGSAFSLPDVAPNSIDLIASRFSFNTGVGGYQPSLFILRRGVNQPNGATLPTLDFGSNEPFAPASATLTIGNSNGDRVQVRSAFNTAGSAQLILDSGIQTTAATHAQYGIPVARLLNTDLHEATVTATDAANTGFRQVVAYSRELASRTLTLGSTLNAPTITVANGVVSRPRAQGVVQADYNKSAIVLFTQPTARKQAWIHVMPGYLGAATNYDLEVPDLSNSPGFDQAWGLTVGSQTLYTFYMSNSPFAFSTGGAGAFSSDGAVWLFGSRSGTLP